MDHLSLDYLMPLLFQERILSQDLVDQIQSEKTPKQRNYAFLTILQRRGSRAFPAFLQALVDADQNHVYERLRHREMSGRREESSSVMTMTRDRCTNEALHCGAQESETQPSAVLSSLDSFPRSTVASLPHATRVNGSYAPSHVAQAESGSDPPFYVPPQFTEAVPCSDHPTSNHPLSDHPSSNHPSSNQRTSDHPSSTTSQGNALRQPENGEISGASTIEEDFQRRLALKENEERHRKSSSLHSLRQPNVSSSTPAQPTPSLPHNSVQSPSSPASTPPSSSASFPAARRSSVEHAIRYFRSPFDIAVKRTEMLALDTSVRLGHGEIYPNFAKPKGLCLIINNREFEKSATDLAYRKGSDRDATNLSVLFEKIG